MKLSIIIPCYNEEKSLLRLFQALKALELPVTECEYFFINDGSTDGTLTILRQLQTQNSKYVHYISFSRHFGKEAALYAGLQASTGDFVTMLDADFQDPPELLVQMFDQLGKNLELDCIAARRTDRKGEPRIRSLFSRAFYKLMGKIVSVPVVNGVRDYRLMTRQMVEAVLRLTEYNRFSKGLFTWVGFNTEYLDYENHERIDGKSRTNFWQLIRYSIDAFVNFSEAPLDLAVYGGLLSVALSVMGVVFIIIRRIANVPSVSGWVSLMILILFCSGVNLIMLGIAGKYISKIFLETKKRPIYIVKEKK